MIAILDRFKGYLIALGAAILTLIAVYVRGRSTGRATERQEREAQINKQADEARLIVQEVRNESASKSDDAILAELERDWVRNNSDTNRR
ncbi:hypothetical protein [Bordetella genomosp. 4]|uniref:Uncharacterized protein n=1 Tax=Bordetella genomosp. 4 TaxID=463044 RepID=A0A261URW1_9BORD|nr:hypothetical protein [Bordetella genomosp. 4]OZI64629.1 hypothetical protein CAL20_02970 [Bordetella genomosp. 4]